MFPVLLSRRCKLRQFSERDLPAFVAYRANPAVARFQSWSSYSLADAERLYAGLVATPFAKPGTWQQVAVADNASDQLLGDCALHFPEDEQQLEIGFTLAPEYQGRGLMREALTRLLDYVFVEMRRHRVIALTDAENNPARKLLLGLDFRQEAHYVKNVFFKGRWSDECLFACLAEEWRAQAKQR